MTRSLDWFGEEMKSTKSVDGTALIPRVLQRRCRTTRLGSIPFHTMNEKRRMLAAHESQRSRVRKQHGIDNYLAATEDWTAARGRSFKVEFAEGFKQYVSHPYPRKRAAPAAARSGTGSLGAHVRYVVCRN
jgi:hypothetical protein